jgi:hypothetical protein
MAKKETTKYRFVGTHADTVYTGLDEKARAIPVAPGDFIEMTDEDLGNENNKPLVEANLFMAIPKEVKE